MYIASARKKVESCVGKVASNRIGANKHLFLCGIRALQEECDEN